MQLKNYNVYFFFVVLIGVSVLAYYILKPFIVPLLIAAILAHLFTSLYQALLKVTKSKGFSSVMTCSLVALIILIPLIFVSSLVVQEVQNMIAHFSQGNGSVQTVIDDIKNNLATIPLVKQFDLGRFINEGTILDAVKGFSQNTLLILQSTYKGVAHLLFVIFIMFFSLFYLLIDGEKLVRKIMRLSPIKDSYENTLIDKFNSITRATIKGTTLVAIIQGFIGSLLFIATGVSSPILLGLIMTVSSVIPAIGAGLVWLPVGIVMILLGHLSAGIIILVVGGLFISTIDNFIKPRLVGKDTQMHPLLILFATLGGIEMFGISGFIVGPIIMSLFVALWDIYYLEFKSQLEGFNK
ncbi:MAG: AI-2E family transporter [Parcubacteria group bacterium]